MMSVANHDRAGWHAELERVLKLDLSRAMLGINNRDLGTFKVGICPFGHFQCFYISASFLSFEGHCHSYGCVSF